MMEKIVTHPLNCDRNHASKHALVKTCTELGDMAIPVR